MEKRLLVALLLVIGAGLFNPRIGVFGFFILYLYWVCECFLSRENLKIVWLSLIIGIGISVGYLAYINGDSSNNVVRNIAQFVRAPHHYSPENWPIFIYSNLFVILSACILDTGNRSDKSLNIVNYISIILITLIFVGIINNFFRISSFLALVNFYQFGQFVLALFFIILLRFIFERQKEGIYYPILLLLMPDIQSKAFLFVGMLILETIKLNTGREEMVRQFMIFTVCICIVVVKYFYQGNTYFPNLVQKPSVTVLLFSTVIFLLILRHLFLNFSLNIVIYICAGIIFLSNVTSLLQGKSQLIIGYKPQAGWLEVCEFAASTQLDSSFILPPEKFDFQHFSKRSTFATFKQVPLNLGKHNEWFVRMQKLRVFPVGLSLENLNQELKKDFRQYDKMTSHDFLKIAQEYPFLTHCIVRNSATPPNLPIVFKNDVYTIYLLKTKIIDT
jgi:hypothetical protein